MANETRIRIAGNNESIILIATAPDAAALAFTVARIAEEGNAKGYVAAVNKALRSRIRFHMVTDYDQPCEYKVSVKQAATKVGRYIKGNFHGLAPSDFRTRCQEWNAA